MLDAIIVGAGQAGLTIGYYLKQAGYNFYYSRQETELVIHGEIDMILLRLFTPSEYSSLPGRILKGARNEFPHKDEIATYLEEYARHFQLPVQLQTEVLKNKERKRNI